MSFYPDRYRVKNNAPVTLINSLRFMLQACEPVIVVEDEPDLTTYRSMLALPLQFLPLHGKPNILDSLKTVTEPTKKNLCRGIVDSDYDLIVRKIFKKSGSPLDGQLIYTDAHSLETLLWKTDDGSMIWKILGYYLTNEAFLKNPDFVKNVQENAYKIAYKMGLVRLVNEIKAYNISQEVELTDDMFEGTSNTFSIKTYVQILLSGARRPLGFEYDILDEYEELEKRHLDKWEVMRGHDITAAYTYLINKYRAKGFAKGKYDCTHDRFEEYTRMTCSIPNLRTSSLYNCVKTWLDSIEAIQKHGSKAC